MDISNLFPQILKFSLGPHHVVQQIPDLRLYEVLLQRPAVRDFSLQHEFVVLVAELNEMGATLASPPAPQSPTVWN